MEASREMDLHCRENSKVVTRATYVSAALMTAKSEDPEIAAVMV